MLMVQLIYISKKFFKTTNPKGNLSNRTLRIKIFIVGVTTTKNHINIDADNKKLQIGDSPKILKISSVGGPFFCSHRNGENFSLFSQNKVQFSKAPR
ncbi:MAG: hypothetical protein CM15mP58_11080 [Burkholderiaceae bacterium]|nr:MAG: hypothetical protein CM15mP58_11080 [Burkholderiaceae bacterium]